MRAGSGIGTLEHPVVTNVSNLTASINPSSSKGDIFIDQGPQELYVSGIYSPGLVVLTSIGGIYGPYGNPAVIANELYIESEGGIQGYDGDFIVSVNNLAVVNGNNGSIYLHNDRTLNLLAAVNEAIESSTHISAQGDIRIINGIVTEGDLFLEASGNIMLGYHADIIAPDWAEVSLSAQGSIGCDELESALQGYWYMGTSGMYFSGTGSYINTGYYYQFGTGPFTLTVWYQGEQTAPFIGLAGATPGMDYGFALENHNGYLRYWLNGERFDSTVAINDNRQYQLSMVRDGTKGSMYIFSDETEIIYTFDVPLADVNNSNPFWIGGWGSPNRLAQGTIYGVRVYNEALSDLRIYAQTLVNPGSGRISAGYAYLSAQTGIDAAFGTVGSFWVNNVSGDVKIDSLSDLTINPETFNYHAGNITIYSAEDLYIEDQLYTLGDYDIDLSASGDIYINNMVYSSLESEHHDVISGDISVSAGSYYYPGNVYINSDVYSYAEGANYAQAGNVTISAYGNIVIDQSSVYSSAYIYEYEGWAEVISGNVGLSAYGSINIGAYGEGYGIYSQAFASGSYADARSGTVSMYASQGIMPALGYELMNYSIYSDASAYAYETSAQAYSSSVNLTSYGDIELMNAAIYSRAYASGVTTASAVAGGYGAYNYEPMTGVYIYSFGDVTLWNESFISSYADVYCSGPNAAGESASASSGSVGIFSYGDVYLECEQYGGEGYGIES